MMSTMRRGLLELMLLLCATIAILSLNCVTAQGNATYTVLAPKTLRAGSSYGVSITLFSGTQPVTFSLRLQEPATSVVLCTANLTLTPINGQEVTGPVSLTIPETVPMASYLLVVEGSGGLTFSQNSSVSVSGKTLSLFIQTDKAFYKPGQLIRLRAIVTRADLKPYKGEMNITIFDHSDNKIVQWLKMQNSSGVVSKDLQLSTQTPLGTWRIELRAMGNVYNKEIDVMEYVLPKFEVKVELPSYYFVNMNQKSVQKDLTISVTAKYTYGEPVKGRANVSIAIAPSWPGESTKYPVKTLDLELKEGKAEAGIPIRQLLALVPLQGWTPEDLWTVLSGRTVVVTASVLETVTGVTLSGNSTVQCFTSRYTLDFLSISADNFKQGLLYIAYLQLSQVDKAAPMISDIKNTQNGQFRSVLVELNYQAENGVRASQQNMNVTLTESGYMMFTVSISSTNITSISITASYFDTVANNTINAYKTITPFKSRDNEGIQVTMSGTSGIIEPNMDVTFSIKTTVAIKTFSYVILNKGTTVMTRTVQETSLTRDHSIHLYFSTPVAQQLSPSFNLLVWYINSKAEIICDSLKVSVNGAFANKVEISFDKEKVAPADTVNLIVNAYPGSHVGLLAVDQSVLLIQSGNDITEQLVKDDLDQYSTSSGTDYPWLGGRGMPGGPIARRKRSVFIGGWWPIFLGGTDTYTLLQNAGLLIMTDAYVHRAPVRYPLWGPPGIMGAPGGMNGAAPVGPRGPAGQPGAAGPIGGVLVEPTTTRTIFPETWLWGDFAVGPGNTTTLTATVPDTITSWVASAFAISDEVGLGVAQTTKVTVFQQFFVSLTLPYSIIRGEEFALKVTVFNYMKENVQVLVTLKKSREFFVRLPNAITPESVEATSTISVPSNDAATAYFWIVAQKLGQISIEVKAQSNMAADAAKRTLLVKPEGVEQSYSSAVFIQLPGNGSEYNSEFTVSLPPYGVLVPDSQFIECTVIGDLMGPSVQGLDSLLQMPYGCGEQNMLTLAPDVYIMDYLTIADLVTSEIAQKALGYMLAGYQRELTYQRTDGSFSAFGNDDLIGSTWLSAFVMKVFSQARDYIPVDDQKMSTTLEWIIQQQNSNGSFAEYGRVIHTDMQGGSSQGLAMSAYCLIALLENRNNPYLNAKFNTSVLNAVKYLENQLTTVGNDSYTLSIMAYALKLAGSSKAEAAHSALMKLAINKDGMTYWQNAAEQSQDSVIGEDGMDVMWRPPYHRTASSNVEVAAYGLMLFTNKRDITGGWPIAKWLISQRTGNGGFMSTQDTVMGLEALAAFAALFSGGSTNGTGLDVLVTAGSSQSRYQTINRATALLLQSFEVPSNVSKVQVKATGKGTALVQLNVRYNTYAVSNENGMRLTINTTYDNDEVTLRSCGSYEGSDESGMVVMDVRQLTGYDLTNVDKIKEQGKGSIMRIENDDQKTVLYINELTKDPLCVEMKSKKNMIVDKVQKAPASLYQYYKPAVSRTLLYAPQEIGTVDYCTSCPQCCVCDSTNQFTCAVGGCRPANVTCNGIQDCPDGSDEKNCGQQGNVSSSPAVGSSSPAIGLNSSSSSASTTSLSTNPTTSILMDANGSTTTILVQLSGSTTTVAPVNNSTLSTTIEGPSSSAAGSTSTMRPSFIACSTTTFKCRNNLCVAGSARCDKKIDCSDGSDEISCPDMCNNKENFVCDNGQCVEKGSRCDRKQDCFDKSDEMAKTCGNTVDRGSLTGGSTDAAVRPGISSLAALVTAILAFLFVAA